MLERQSRAQETGMIVWFPQQKLSQKMALWIGPRVRKIRSKMQKIWRHQQKTPNPKSNDL